MYVCVGGTTTQASPVKASTGGSLLEWKSYTGIVSLNPSGRQLTKLELKALVIHSHLPFAVRFLHLAVINQQGLLSLKLGKLDNYRNNSNCGTPNHLWGVLVVAPWASGSTDGERKNNSNVLLSLHPRRDVFAAN